MSLQAMAWAIEQQEVTEPASRHVLLCLANYADRDGHDAFPAVSTLAKETGLSERTVRYKLDYLLEVGLISHGDQRIVAAKIARADRRPTVFNLNMERGATAAPRCAEPCGQVIHRGANGAPRSRERGATDAGTGCNRRQNGVQQLHPIQELYPKADPAAKAVLKNLEQQKPKGTKREGEHLRAVAELLKPAVGE